MLGLRVRLTRCISYPLSPPEVNPFSYPLGLTCPHTCWVNPKPTGVGACRGWGG